MLNMVVSLPHEDKLLVVDQLDAAGSLVWRSLCFFKINQLAEWLPQREPLISELHETLVGESKVFLWE